MLALTRCVSGLAFTFVFSKAGYWAQVWSLGKRKSSNNMYCRVSCIIVSDHLLPDAKRRVKPAPSVSLISEHTKQKEMPKRNLGGDFPPYVTLLCHPKTKIAIDVSARKEYHALQCFAQGSFTFDPTRRGG